MKNLTLTHERMYQAILEKDTAFEGIFFTAVKTTGIFCRPSCTARKPKSENVEFFATTKECILKGYRPCKVCRPLQNLAQTPTEIQAILDEFTQNPSLKFTDFELKQRNIDPKFIRRWFLKNHDMTFHAFCRLYRINSAFKKIQSGEQVTHAAFDSGFDSLSGFSESFKKVFGISPKHSKSQGIIDLKRIETPLGTMIACATDKGICLLEFSDRKMLETELKNIAKRQNAIITQGGNPFFYMLETQLNEYFSKKRTEFDVPLHLIGTDFQKKVWQVLQQIPYGKTYSYGQQAGILGNPKAVRAVANANGMNSISILVPCHRVIGANGELTGYGGGLWRKQYLLELEKSFSGNILF